ncbi:hypothetical protein M9H77_03414 [Catharanthus roseus]|uniref:Uncharacterized protein n=1 Tax=Catharanthus roseus TaxID=4058 RepID=A0ACC0CB91_CATRO|nr:hypothetical protein M9H77_03414 [Catharanthus roseus]
MQEVVKKEVVKLLDAGIIYPILNNIWVNLVQVLPKKGGMTVVANEKNKLTPTRQNKQNPTTDDWHPTIAGRVIIEESLPRQKPIADDGVCTKKNEVGFSRSNTLCLRCLPEEKTMKGNKNGQKQSKNNENEADSFNEEDLPPQVGQPTICGRSFELPNFIALIIFRDKRDFPQKLIRPPSYQVIKLEDKARDSQTSKKPKIKRHFHKCLINEYVFSSCGFWTLSKS